MIVERDAPEVSERGEAEADDKESGWTRDSADDPKRLCWAYSSSKYQSG